MALTPEQIRQQKGGAAPLLPTDQTNRAAGFDQNAFGSMPPQMQQRFFQGGGAPTAMQNQFNTAQSAQSAAPALPAQSFTSIQQGGTIDPATQSFTPATQSFTPQTFQVSTANQFTGGGEPTGAATTGGSATTTGTTGTTATTNPNRKPGWPPANGRDDSGWNENQPYHPTNNPVGYIDIHSGDPTSDPNQQSNMVAVDSQGRTSNTANFGDGGKFQGRSRRLPGTTPGTTQIDLSLIDPKDSLRRQQINPTGSEGLDILNADLRTRAGTVAGQSLGEFDPIAPTKLTGSRSAITGAQGEIANIGSVDFSDQGIAAGTFAQSPEAIAARAAASSALSGINEGPDRTQLALDAFGRFRDETDPAFQEQIRGVGQRAAALGRIGSGLTTTELGDVTLQRSRDLGREERRLTDEATGLSLQDRERSLNAALGAGRTFTGQDIDTAGFLRDLRSEGRTERRDVSDTVGTNADLALARAGLGRGVASDLAGLAQTERRDLESDRDFDFDRRAANADLALRGLSAAGNVSDRQFGQELTGRNELRGERDFQDRLARFSIGDRVTQAELEERFKEGAFQRNLDISRVDAALIAAGQPRGGFQIFQGG